VFSNGAFEGVGAVVESWLGSFLRGGSFTKVDSRRNVRVEPMKRSAEGNTINRSLATSNIECLIGNAIFLGSSCSPSHFTAQ